VSRKNSREIAQTRGRDEEHCLTGEAGVDVTIAVLVVVDLYSSSSSPLAVAAAFDLDCEGGG